MSNKVGRPFTLPTEGDEYVLLAADVAEHRASGLNWRD